MTEIQQKIVCYIGDKAGPSDFDLLCFVGMIESGEAKYRDFEAVGGISLADAVENRKRTLDDAREK